VWGRITPVWARVPPWLRLAATFGAFAAVSVWLTTTTFDQVTTSRLDIGPLTDFRDAIYYPLVAVFRDGVNPYDVDTYYRQYPVGQEFPLYTPIHLLVHTPLLAFSFTTARAVAWGANLALVLVYAGVLLRLAGARLTAAGVLGLGTLVLLSDPGRFTMRSGQPTLMIAIGIVLAWRAAAAPRTPPGSEAAGLAAPTISFWWGVLGVVLVWSKPTYAIPLVVLLVARSRLRLALTGTAVAGALSLLVLPLLVAGAGGVSPLLDSWSESARVTSRSLQSRLGSGLRIDFANGIVRVTRYHFSETVGVALGLLVLLGGAWLIARLHRRDPAGDRDELAVALGCLLIVLGTYHVSYDHLLLLAPLVLLLRPGPHHAVAWPRRVRTTVIVLMLVLVVDPLGWSVVNGTFGASGFEWMAKATALAIYSIVALGLCVWTAVRQTRAAGDRPPVAAEPAPG
jgi:hypothetical protein